MTTKPIDKQLTPAKALEKAAWGVSVKRRPWTPEQVAALRHLYPDHSAEVVGKVLGRKPGSVHQKARSLGIEKSEAFNQSDRSGRIQRGRQNPAMVATQFKPGFTPWNKGVNWVAGGRSAETRFKKGQMSGAAQHNYVPIGSFRINADGHLEQKVTDDPALVPARRWTPVYRLVWERENGPIHPDLVPTHWQPLPAPPSTQGGAHADQA